MQHYAKATTGDKKSGTQKTFYYLTISLQYQPTPFELSEISAIRFEGSNGVNLDLETASPTPENGNTTLAITPYSIDHT